MFFFTEDEVASAEASILNETVAEAAAADDLVGNVNIEAEVALYNLKEAHATAANARSLASARAERVLTSAKKSAAAATKSADSSAAALGRITTKKKLALALCKKRMLEETARHNAVAEAKRAQKKLKDQQESEEKEERLALANLQKEKFGKK